MKGDPGQLCPLCSRPASASRLSHLRAPSSLPHHPTNRPQFPADPPRYPVPPVRGGSVLPMAAPSPSKSSWVSLSHSQLPTGSWNLAFLPSPRWIRPMARGGAPPGSHPTMHCTSEREQPRGIGAPGPPPGPAGGSTAHRKTRARLPWAPSVLTRFSGRASSLIPSLSAPVSLLPSTPSLLNHFISIIKENYRGGGRGKSLGVYYHIHMTMLILSFLKEKKKISMLLFRRLRFIVPV